MSHFWQAKLHFTLVRSLSSENLRQHNSLNMSQDKCFDNTVSQQNGTFTVELKAVERPASDWDMCRKVSHSAIYQR